MMQAIRDRWNALPWYVQVPIAALIAPPLIVLTVCGVALGILPMMCWMTLDDLINDRRRPMKKGG